MTDLLEKWEHIEISELTQHLSMWIKKNKILVITEQGTPVSILLPYGDMLGMLHFLEALS